MDDTVLISFGEELYEATQRYISAVQSGNADEQRINLKRLEDAYICIRYYTPMTEDYKETFPKETK